MKIVPARTAQAEEVFQLAQDVIAETYPHYYPRGAVDFFPRYHNREAILNDIAAGRVWVLEAEGTCAGTVTIRENEISRLFVSVKMQRRGYGSRLLDFCEQRIFAAYDRVLLDASFPARGLYGRRGYRLKDYGEIACPGGDILCYDVMELEEQQDR